MNARNKVKFTKYFYLLQLLKKNCKGNCKEKFQKLISYLDEETLNFLAECIRNILSPQTINILPKNKQKKLIKKVSPFKKTVKRVINKGTPFNLRKKYIQHGGAWFLPLISAVIPLISSLVGSAISKSK
jgi:hypothetical protein